MSALKSLQSGFAKFGKQFEMLWITPGAMRWINPESAPDKYYSAWGVFATQPDKTMKQAGEGMYQATKKRLILAKVKLCVVGALTLPVGLPVALVALPVMFAYKGVPFLRSLHLDKIQKMLETDFKFHKVCGRQVAKILTVIGHPKLEKVCDKCRAIAEGWAQDAIAEINSGGVKVDTSALAEVFGNLDDEDPTVDAD